MLRVTEQTDTKADGVERVHITLEHDYDHVLPVRFRVADDDVWVWLEFSQARPKILVDGFRSVTLLTQTVEGVRWYSAVYNRDRRLTRADMEVMRPAGEKEG